MIILLTYRKKLLIYYLSEAEYKAKQGKGKGLKLLTIKKCIHTLPIALAQVRTGNTSLNLINEIYQIKYSLYQANEITEKVYKNTIQCRYNTKEILYLWILKIVKHPILLDYYPIF